MIEYARAYTPDLAGWFTKFGQGASAYDANGHYARIQPIFSPFSLTDLPRAGGRRALAARPRPEPAQRVQLRQLPPLPRRRRAAAARRLGAGARVRLRPGRDPMRRLRDRTACSVSASRVRGARSASARTDEGGGYKVRAIFDNVAAAVPGEDVKIAGAQGRRDRVAGRHAGQQGGGRAADRGRPASRRSARTRAARSGRSR